MEGSILLGELAKFCFNAAMPHAHPGQSWTNISGCPWKHKTIRFITWNKHTHTHTYGCYKVSCCTFTTKVSVFLPQNKNTDHIAVLSVYITAVSVLCKVNAGKGIVAFKEMNYYQADVMFYIQPVFTQVTNLPLVDTTHTTIFIQIK